MDISIHNGPRITLLWGWATDEPPAGGASQTVEPIGAKINDIFIYISICMYVCIKVASRSLQGRFKVASRSVRFGLFFAVGTARVCASCFILREEGT